ncbi:MAG TPA: glucose 1-dehydrogenase [Tepidisphaeraceae bacterium]|jgi:NAD(P)-dependent dehydrogenase (short-subunit alcohol dehydrogenase family)|nr:glucose 1-dehydrogenase [Tepidisphaeraceae bacterium]
MQIAVPGKVVIVTGASSGIGLAMLPVFLEAEAAGMIAVFLESEPPAALHALRERWGQRVRLVAGDVRAEATAQRFTRAALDHFGRIDVLINNAAVSVVKPLHEHSPQEWDAVMETNVKAIYWSARHVIPVMMRQGGGVILNSGSISGAVGIPTQGAYAPSKGAIHQMTRQMAVEYAPHKIRVNAICCGTVDTPLVQRSAEASGDPDAYWAMLRQGHPIGRIATPEEVAKFYLYMASDEASFFTGARIMMDGGYTAR